MDNKDHNAYPNIVVMPKSMIRAITVSSPIQNQVRKLNILIYVGLFDVRHSYFPVVRPMGHLYYYLIISVAHGIILIISPYKTYIFKNKKIDPKKK